MKVDATWTRTTIDREAARACRRRTRCCRSRAPSLQRERDEIAEAAARHRVLARKQPVVGLEADLRPAVHGPRQQHRRETACGEGRDGVGKEQPDVAAVSGARPLECCRNSELAACGQECERVARPALVVEVNGEKAAGVVEQQRIDTSDKITAAIVAGRDPRQADGLRSPRR
jgi:hypothetical protein